MRKTQISFNEELNVAEAPFWDRKSKVQFLLKTWIMKLFLDFLSNKIIIFFSKNGAPCQRSKS